MCSKGLWRRDKNGGRPFEQTDNGGSSGEIDIGLFKIQQSFQDIEVGWYGKFWICQRI